jgi:hypothetical protein
MSRLSCVLHLVVWKGGIKESRLDINLLDIPPTCSGDMEDRLERLETGSGRGSDGIIAAIDLTTANDTVAHLVPHDVTAHIPFAMIYGFEVEDGFAQWNFGTKDELVHPLAMKHVELLLGSLDPTGSIGGGHRFSVVARVVRILDVDGVLAEVCVQLHEHCSFLAVVVLWSSGHGFCPVAEDGPLTIILGCDKLGCQSVSRRSMTRTL